MDSLTAATAAPTDRITANGTEVRAPEDDNSSAVASDFETFLALLTAQMRNQDPLKPIESTEFVSQLASFSAVEQQVRSNDTLDSILAALSGDSMSGLSQWIGREVRAVAAVAFDGAPVTVFTQPVADSTAAELVVRDVDGVEIARQAIPTAEPEIVWDGLMTDGSPAQLGDYRFSVDYIDQAGNVTAIAGEVFVPVTEVRIVDGNPSLVVADGTSVSLDGVPAIRAAG